MKILKLRDSAISADWWDYTCLPSDLIDEAARLTPRDIERLSRPGFRVVFYETLEDFYLAEALEYIDAWRQSTDDNPVGICGPIGPTEQLPLVARLVNSLGLDVRRGHFWGMDEWFDPATGREVPVSHPLSFEKADREMCFSRIDRKLRMPDAHLHFPKADTAAYRKTWDAGVRCAVMQGGQGDVKHWAFNDPLPRRGKYKAAPPTPAEYRRLATRVVELHPLTIAQNARTSGGGNISMVNQQGPQTDSDLWVLPMQGDRTPGVFLKTPYRELHARFSPDDRWVAYQSNESGRPEIYVRPFVLPLSDAATSTPAALDKSTNAQRSGSGAMADGQWQVSSAGGIFPAWRADGKELYYLDSSGAMVAVPIAVNGSALEPGAPVVLFPTSIFGGGVDAQQGRQYDVAPDGRFLINTVLESAAVPITLILNWRPEGNK